MKILIFISILYISYCSSQYVDPQKKANTAFPKKVPAALIQYNNAGKYLKPLAPKSTLNPKIANSYTVFGKPFPVSDQVGAVHQIVPDSPYFPVDEPEPHERRSRVKKVLPEDASGRRYKRSPDSEVANAPTHSNASTDAVSHSKAKPKAAAKTHVSEAAAKKKKSPVKTASNPKSVAKLRKQRVGKKKRAVKGSIPKVYKKLQRQGVKNKVVRPGSKKRVKRVLKSNAAGQKAGAGAGLKKKVGRSRVRKSKVGAKKVRKAVARNGTSKLKAKAPRKLKGNHTRRLIAARDALIEEYPYTISIQKDGEHWCAGAILNPRLIITTANCLWRSNSISRMRVRVGSRHTDRGGQVARIQEVMKHPGWRLRKNPDNDVALAVLDRNIKFSHALHGVDLPNRVMWPSFDDAWITSWGSERKDGIYDPPATRNLQVYHARLIERDKCNNVTVRFGVAVTENFICLSQLGRRGPCTRDTGAPAVSDGVLWGLASWGIRKLCGTERFPAVFSYLASQSNMDFIANATHYLMSEERHYPYPDRYPLRKYSITPPPPPTFPYK